MDTQRPPNSSDEEEKVSIEIGKPKLFTSGRKDNAFLVISLLVVIPILIVYLPFLIAVENDYVMSWFLSSVGLDGFWGAVGIVTLLVVSLCALYYPLLQGSLFYRRTIERGNPCFHHSGRFLTQVTFTPRIQKGLEAIVDDADDIGCLLIETDRLHFYGDFTTLQIPFGAIGSLSFKTAKARHFWLGARRIALSLKGDKDPRGVEFVCTEGFTLPGLRKANARLITTLHRQIDQWLMRESPIAFELPPSPEKRYPLG